MDTLFPNLGCIYEAPVYSLGCVRKQLKIKMNLNPTCCITPSPPFIAAVHVGLCLLLDTLHVAGGTHVHVYNIPVHDIV